MLISAPFRVVSAKKLPSNIQFANIINLLNCAKKRAKILSFVEKYLCNWEN